MVESKKRSVKDITHGNSGKSYSKASGLRGSANHTIRAKFLTQVFKKGNKIPTNHSQFSQKLRNLTREIIQTTRANATFSEYSQDISDLLKSLCKDIVKVSKDISFENNNKFTPEQVEIAYFGGITQFEEYYSAEYDGDEIAGVIDQIVYVSPNTFKIGEFKTGLRDTEKDPSDPESKNYHDWEQAAMYAFIVEEQSNRKCLSFKLIFHPNKETQEYEFTDEIRNHVQNLIKEKRFAPLKFKVSSKTVTHQDPEISEENGMIDEEKDSFIPPAPISVKKSLQNVNKNQEIGFLSTTRNKPLQLKRNGENRLEGFLWANRASMVKEGYFVAVLKEDGIRIVCIIEEIKSWEDTVRGDISSHHEEVYAVKLNPKYEMFLSGPESPRPQTIQNGKIMMLDTEEFYLMNRLPKHGMRLGTLEDCNDGDYEYSFDPIMFYQSVFVGGVQGTGKTTALKEMILSLSNEEKPPAIIIFDAEREFTHLDKIPTTRVSEETMKINEIEPLDPKNFERIKIEELSGECLTLATIDPIQLPLFLHELSTKSYTQILRIIQNLKYDYPNRQFTFPGLRQAIDFVITNSPSRQIHQQVGQAIQRALQNIAMDLFDMPNRVPIDIKKMMQPGKVTVIDVYDLRDDQQRIVALYILALFHQYNMKRKESEEDDYPGVVLFLDEVQRILPENSSNSDYQKRIISFLSEIHHRGRKKDYGIIYATQSPADIKRVIINLCNTKIFFQIRGSVDFMKEYLDKYKIEELKRLSDGVAYVMCKGRHEPVKVRFPFIK